MPPAFRGFPRGTGGEAPSKRSEAKGPKPEGSDLEVICDLYLAPQPSTQTNQNKTNKPKEKPCKQKTKKSTAHSNKR